MKRHLKSLLRNPFRYISNQFKFKKNTDLERWADPKNLASSWDARTIIMAGLLPEGAQVVEFGAARLILKEHLPKNCTYQPIDIVKRSPDTIEVDLNEALPKLPQKYTHAVFSGVIEYVKDLPATLTWLRGVADEIIVSYATVDHLSDPITRMENGWINDFTDAQIQQFFMSAGYSLHSKTRWQEQTIYVYKVKDHVS